MNMGAKVLQMPASIFQPKPLPQVMIYFGQFSTKARHIGLTPPIGDLVTVCNILSQCKGLAREAAKGFVSRPLRRKRGGGIAMLAIGQQGMETLL